MATVGKYQVVEQIGEGAMGVVYKAQDPVLNRTVAIKVMSEGLAQDEVLRERFLREAQAAGSLQHPNLVTIYDFGETDGHLFIAMEYIEGADLEKLMAKGTPLNLPTKLDLIIDVLNGLSFAHRRGIVHRDIKPANIRIDQEGRARIMDFGVAKMSTSNLTGTGVMMGTPNYMAPEQITGDKTLGPAADLWAVGAVLYELLTSKRPFEADTLHRVLFRIVSDNPSTVTQTVPGLPIALDEIVKKALAKEPENRYRTAAEMANAVAAVRAKVGAPRLSRTVSQRSSIEAELKALKEKGEHRPASGGGATFVMAPTPAATPATTPTPAPPPVQIPAVTQSARPSWALIGGGALALLIAVGAVAYFASRAGRSTTRPLVAANSPAVNPPAATQATPPPTAAPEQASPPTTRPSQVTASSQATPPSPSATPTRDRATSRTTAAAPQRSTPRRAASDSPRVVSNPPAQVQSTPAPASQGTPAASQTQTQAQTQTPVQSQAVAPPVSNVPPPQPVSAPQTAVVSPPPSSSAPAPAAENPRPAIEAVLTEYAAAIGTRQLPEVRRVYAGMTAQQQSGWEALFSSTRSIKATLDIASLNLGTGNAVARVTGAYEFVTRAGRSERQPASFEATFAKQGDVWVLQRIR